MTTDVDELMRQVIDGEYVPPKMEDIVPTPKSDSQLVVRVPKATLETLDRLVEGRDMSRSELVRKLIDAFITSRA